MSLVLNFTVIPELQFISVDLQVEGIMVDRVKFSLFVFFMGKGLLKSLCTSNECSCQNKYDLGIVLIPISDEDKDSEMQILNVESIELVYFGAQMHSNIVLYITVVSITVLQLIDQR